MTHRQLVAWLKWKWWYSLPPEERNKPEPPKQFILTKEKIAEINQERRKKQIVGPEGGQRGDSRRDHGQVQRGRYQSRERER